MWVEMSCHMTECMSPTAGGWMTEMTRTLVSVWVQANVQSELDRVIRNRTIFERISRELKEMGIYRTWQQCQTKIKNLK